MCGGLASPILEGVLDRVSFKNFKSLKAVTIDLAPLTVLVGPNGGGKSSEEVDARIVPVLGPRSG